MFASLMPYKNILIAIIVAAAFASGYYRGFMPEHEKLISFQANVEQAAADQKAAAKQKDEENAKQVQDVATAYDAYYKRLIAGLQRDKASSSRLPSIADSSKETNEAEQQRSRACEGTEFYANALEDALKLQAWQDWALRLHLPQGD